MTDGSTLAVQMAAAMAIMMPPPGRLGPARDNATPAPTVMGFTPVRPTVMGRASGCSPPADYW